MTCKIANENLLRKLQVYSFKMNYITPKFGVFHIFFIFHILTHTTTINYSRKRGSVKNNKKKKRTFSPLFTASSQNV